MRKPSIYLDSSFISAYWYSGPSVEGQLRRMKTRDWWNAERRLFELWGSAFVELELRSGVYRHQSKCIRMSRSLKTCPSTSAVKRFFSELLEKELIPPNKPMDAWHLSFTVCHEIDYLPTWNYAHLANSAAQARLNKLCGDLQLRPPLLVSPESIPQIRFGQAVFRGA